MKCDLDSLRTLARLCKAGWHSRRVDVLLPPDLNALAARHRVAGLAAAGAGDSKGAQAAVARSLQQLAECRRLSDLLAPVDPLFLKGLAVAALGYDEPLLKHSADIDLLVSAENVTEAASTLRGAGYRLVFPSDGVSLERWHAVSNQSVWENGRHRVELHDSATPIVGLFDAPAEEAQAVSVGGLALRTLGDRDQFAYLAVHGGLSLWFRLKWLVDFAAFAERRTASLADDLQHAAKLGAGRSTALALLLAHDLFDLDVPSSVLDRSRSDWRVRLLYHRALEVMCAGEPTERRLGTLPLHLASALLAPSPGALVSRAANLLGQRRLASANPAVAGRP